jgi:diguanylate cyclase (GGDEF)-like protein/PAS domain S-box-containing protein
VPANPQPQSARKERSPHRLRGLIIGTALIVGAIVGANAVVLHELHQGTLREAQTSLLRQSLTLSEIVERTLESADLVLASMVEKVRVAGATDRNLHQLAGQDFHAFLQQEKSELPQIETLGIIDANGKRIATSRHPASPDIDLSSREYYQALRDHPGDRLYVSEPVQGRSSGAWVVILARPVLTKQGEFLGVAFAATPMSYFEKLFASTSLGEGYAATLLRRDGTLLARYPMAGQIGNKAPASVLAKLADSRSGVSRSVSPIDRQARIAAAYRLVNYPLVVVATQSETAAFAGWHTTATMMAVIAFVMMVMIAVAAGLIARSWSQQDRLNAARAEIIEAGKVHALAEAEVVRQRDLAEQNMRFNAAVENMSQGLCMFDRETRLVVCNELYASMYRLPDELRRPGALHRDIITHRVRNGILKGGHGESAVQHELTALSALPADARSSRVDEHADGKIIRVTRQPLPGGGWVATHEDITERRRAEQELDETKRFLDSIIQNIPVAVVVKDAKTRRFILINRAFEALIGWPLEDLLGRTVFDIYGAKDATFIDDADRASLDHSGGVNYAEYNVETPVRGARILATNRIVIRGADGDAKYLINVIDDVTERKKSEQRIAFMAHHDALTGLANRATLTEEIEKAAAHQRRWGDPFAVLMLDLDRFKHVNDTLGHSAGDALLREAATRLQSLLADTDVLARLGGDEFAVIRTGDADPGTAAGAMADRIIATIARPFVIDGNEVNIGTSIGIAIAPDEGTDPGSLLKMADMALYRAKSGGRSRYCFFDPHMGVEANERHALEYDLRRAIQKDELELHYQPIVDCRTLRICGAEALVRWRHPTKGMVFPDTFIPLAEDTGMIAQIGDWVLRQACADAASWPDDVKVSVNLSPVQFRKASLPDSVMHALADAGLRPERLELEITETALIESAAECLTALHRFKSAGIAIALDDFGTGYSSLSQLTMFPFDRIKIDKTFTQDMTRRSESAAIISAALTLAHSLNIATTAEGVETPEQYQLLRLAGVTSLQGYLFARPCPVAQIDFGAAFAEPRLAGAA